MVGNPEAALAPCEVHAGHESDIGSISSDGEGERGSPVFNLLRPRQTRPNPAPVPLCTDVEIPMVHQAKAVGATPATLIDPTRPALRPVVPQQPILQQPRPRGALNAFQAPRPGTAASAPRGRVGPDTAGDAAAPRPWRGLGLRAPGKAALTGGPRYHSPAVLGADTHGGTHPAAPVTANTAPAAAVPGASTGPAPAGLTRKGARQVTAREAGGGGGCDAPSASLVSTMRPAAAAPQPRPPQMTDRGGNTNNHNSSSSHGRADSSSEEDFLGDEDDEDGTQAPRFNLLRRPTARAPAAPQQQPPAGPLAVPASATAAHSQVDRLSAPGATTTGLQTSCPLVPGASRAAASPSGAPWPPRGHPTRTSAGCGGAGDAGEGGCHAAQKLPAGPGQVGTAMQQVPHPSSAVRPSEKAAGHLVPGSGQKPAGHREGGPVAGVCSPPPPALAPAGSIPPPGSVRGVVSPAGQASASTPACSLPSSVTPAEGAVERSSDVALVSAIWAAYSRRRSAPVRFQSLFHDAKGADEGAPGGDGPTLDPTGSPSQRAGQAAHQDVAGGEVDGLRDEPPPRTRQRRVPEMPLCRGEQDPDPPEAGPHMTPHHGSEAEAAVAAAAAGPSPAGRLVPAHGAYGGGTLPPQQPQGALGAAWEADGGHPPPRRRRLSTQRGTAGACRTPGQPPTPQSPWQQVPPQQQQQASPPPQPQQPPRPPCAHDTAAPAPPVQHPAAQQQQQQQPTFQFPQHPTHPPASQQGAKPSQVRRQPATAAATKRPGAAAAGGKSSILSYMRRAVPAAPLSASATSSPAEHVAPPRPRARLSAPCPRVMDAAVAAARGPVTIDLASDDDGGDGCGGIWVFEEVGEEGAGARAAGASRGTGRGCGGGVRPAGMGAAPMVSLLDDDEDGQAAAAGARESAAAGAGGTGRGAAAGANAGRRRRLTLDGSVDDGELQLEDEGEDEPGGGPSAARPNGAPQSGPKRRRRAVLDGEEDEEPGTRCGHMEGQQSWHQSQDHNKERQQQHERQQQQRSGFASPTTAMGTTTNPGAAAQPASRNACGVAQPAAVAATAPGTWHGIHGYSGTALATSGGAPTMPGGAPTMPHPRAQAPEEEEEEDAIEDCSQDEEEMAGQGWRDSAGCSAGGGLATAGRLSLGHAGSRGGPCPGSGILDGGRDAGGRQAGEVFRRHSLPEGQHPLRLPSYQHPAQAQARAAEAAGGTSGRGAGGVAVGGGGGGGGALAGGATQEAGLQWRDGGLCHTAQRHHQQQHQGQWQQQQWWPSAAAAADVAPWWTLLPDFVPAAAMAGGYDPRTVPRPEPVFILYQKQFNGPANSAVAPMHRNVGYPPGGAAGAGPGAGGSNDTGAGPAFGGRSWGGAGGNGGGGPGGSGAGGGGGGRAGGAADDELVDWAREVVGGGKGRSRGGGGSRGGNRSRRGGGGAVGDAVAAGGTADGDGEGGRWYTNNQGARVYVENGNEYTGREAYRRYKRRGGSGAAGGGSGRSKGRRKGGRKGGRRFRAEAKPKATAVGGVKKGGAGSGKAASVAGGTWFAKGKGSKGGKGGKGGEGGKGK